MDQPKNCRTETKMSKNAARIKKQEESPQKTFVNLTNTGQTNKELNNLIDLVLSELKNSVINEYMSSEAFSNSPKSAIRNLNAHESIQYRDLKAEASNKKEIDKLIHFKDHTRPVSCTNQPTEIITERRKSSLSKKWLEMMAKSGLKGETSTKASQLPTNDWPVESEPEQQISNKIISEQSFKQKEEEKGFFIKKTEITNRKKGQTTQKPQIKKPEIQETKITTRTKSPNLNLATTSLKSEGNINWFASKYEPVIAQTLEVELTETQLKREKWTNNFQNRIREQKSNNHKKVDALEESQKVREASQFVLELSRSQTRIQSPEKVANQKSPKSILEIEANQKLENEGRVRREVDKYANRIVSVLKKKFENKRNMKLEKIKSVEKIREEKALSQIRQRNSGYDPTEVVS